MSKLKLLASMAEDVRRLYVDEHLSITDVRAELLKRDHAFSRWDVGALIKQMGIMRSRKHAMLTSRRKHNGWLYHPKERMCRLCEQPFLTHSPIAAVCSVCAPDEKSRGRALQYGITKKQYDDLREQQHDKCAICLVDFETLSSKMIHIDHCHVTGRVRGILCKWCNLSMGHVDDEVWLNRALTYKKASNV